MTSSASVRTDQAGRHQVLYLRGRSKKGSSAVFLCVVLAALVSICFAFIYSTLEYTTASRADSVMRLSGDSLMSEFDMDILEKYGLFLLRGTDRDLSEKLRNYLLFTFGDEENVRLSDIRASGASFTAADPEPVREQILSYMKAGGALRLALPDEAGDNDADEPVISDKETGRALRHGPTIASLPSRRLPDRDLITLAEQFGQQFSAISDVFTDGTEKFLLTSYVLGTFNSAARTADRDHFFLREVEYVLNGGLSDSENRRKTAAGLKMLRLGPNLAHIYTDPAKQESLAAAADLLTPGPAALLTQAALATAWAYAESSNDAELLMKGYRVPVSKDRESWAISLSRVIEDAGDGDGVIRPELNKGLSYEQYLRVLLFLEDRDLMTARVLDLIQINMRKNVDGKFLIGECCTGVSLQATINGRDYRYEKLYERLLYR